MEIGVNGETGLLAPNLVMVEIKLEFVCAMTHLQHTVDLSVQVIRCTRKL